MRSRLPISNQALSIIRVSCSANSSPDGESITPSQTAVMHADYVWFQVVLWQGYTVPWKIKCLLTSLPVNTTVRQNPLSASRRVVMAVQTEPLWVINCKFTGEASAKKESLAVAASCSMLPCCYREEDAPLASLKLSAPCHKLQEPSNVLF